MLRNGSGDINFSQHRTRRPELDAARARISPKLAQVARLSNSAATPLSTLLIPSSGRSPPLS
jgi:hypothetical protein